MPNMRTKYRTPQRIQAVAFTPVNRAARQPRCSPIKPDDFSQLGSLAEDCGGRQSGPAMAGLTWGVYTVLMKRSLGQKAGSAFLALERPASRVREPVARDRSRLF